MAPPAIVHSVLTISKQMEKCQNKTKTYAKRHDHLVEKTIQARKSGCALKQEEMKLCQRAQTDFARAAVRKIPPRVIVQGS